MQEITRIKEKRIKNMDRQGRMGKKNKTLGTERCKSFHILSINVFEIVSARKKKRGKTLNSWVQELTTGMREKGINNIKEIDREEWGRKIKL